MKHLLLALLLVLSLQADKLILTGISFHGESANVDGTKVNPYNYGIGYQKEYNYDNFTTTATIIILYDSFKHAMGTATYGIGKSIAIADYELAASMEFGIAHKQVTTRKDAGYIKYYEYRHRLVPIAFVPTLSITKGNYGLGILYLPKISYKDIRIMEVALITLSIKL